MLWLIIFGLQLDKIIDQQKIESEIETLNKSLTYRIRMGDKAAESGNEFIIKAKRNEYEDKVDNNIGANQQKKIDGEKEKTNLILSWARMVCAHYGLEVSLKIDHLPVYSKISALLIIFSLK